MKIDSKFVLAYHAFMCEKFKAIVVPHNEIINRIPDSEEIDFFFLGLKMLGVEKPWEWLKKRSFTLGPYISVNYTPGVGTATQLLKQCGILAHELGHRIQWEKEENFGYRYVTSTAGRADLEVWAEYGRHEAQFLLNGTIPSAASFARTLVEAYYCRPGVEPLVKKKLDMHATIVRRGAVMTDVGKATKQFINKWSFDK